jgi:CelD/BcsL family acetyltransferase involved in cellulose biosynthesis
MALKIVRGKEAAETLRNEGFRSKWGQLYQECPWATAAQSPAFVTSWYEAYKQQYSLVLVCEFSASGAMTGFLPLALNGSGRAELPGAHQADYKSWLALASNGKSFLEASLKLLSRETEIGALLFRYLPSGAPVGGGGASSGSPWICEMESHTRPIVRLGSGAEVREYVRRKTNKIIKNRWNRLKRIGNVRLERIAGSEELVPIFDQLIDWYEIRQEMAHGKRPFQADKNKKKWHLELLKEGLLHLTLLKAGQEVLSAIFGLSDGKTYSMMMPVFNPEYAHYSPIALHHLMLVERLHTEGFSVLDLTPGSDPFKERFAAEYEDLNVLSIYLKQREWIKAKVRQRSEAIAKGMLSALGIAPSSVVRTLPRAQEFLGVFLRAFPRSKRRSSRQSPHIPEPV